jgi:type IV secretion system protein VirB10
MTPREPVVQHSLPGERGRPLVARALSAQARLSNLLAVGLVLMVGIGLLGWYYLQVTGRASRERRAAQLGLQDKARAEMPLPSLGELEPPVTTAAPIADVETPRVTTEPALTPLPVLPPWPTQPSAVTATVAGRTTAGRPTALERRLSGSAFVTASANASGVSPAETASAPPPGEASSSAAGAHGSASGGELPTWLNADAVRTAYARVLPSQRLLLPKGAFIDCTLETAIDSSLPGLTTCVTATDTFSADGKVVLLERGTKLIGETRGQVQQASTRVFVLWTEARTPTGVIVPLDSPGADELGRSGLPGQVERHFWQRFGAAILVSVLDGGVQAATASVSHGSGNIVYTPTGPQEIMGSVLKDSANIPPTVIKHNGDRVQVLAARDVDFSRVYELTHVNVGH